MNVSQTAQAVAQIGTLNIPALLALLASVVVAALSAPALQSVIEGLVARVIPTPLFFIKPFLPSALSGLLGGLALHLGVSPDDAAAGALALASFTHWVNQQPWATALEAKSPAAVKEVEGSLGIGAASKALILVLSFLCLAGLAHATEIGFSQSAVLGSGLYRPQADGSIVSSGGAATGYQLNVSFGNLSGTAWTNYFSVSLGGAAEVAPLNMDGSGLTTFGDLAWGLGTGVGNIVPGVANTNLLLGGFTRVLGRKNYDTTSYGFSVNYTLGTPFWILK